MPIQINNWPVEASVTYSLPILYGDVHPSLYQGSVRVTNQSSGSAILWPVYNGCFKVVVPLLAGRNKVQIRYFEETTELVFHYTVPKTPRFVRPIYLCCCDHEGTFQAPEDECSSVESAQKRISLGAKLIQSFTAEKLNEQGLGRTTFTLESDLDPSVPSCHVFKSAITLEQAHAMSGTDLWTYFAKELMSSAAFTNKEYCKWFAFMSFTRYIPPPDSVPKSHSEVMKRTKGHTALGGGGLALFGTGNLHTWAETLDELVTRFTDTRRIDRTKLMDDSAYREFYWANYSTGLGASLHELGHTFDLAHTPTGIMARGFDDLYRVFTVQPLQSRPCSRSSSGVPSPVPYSPKSSPIHKPLFVNTGHGGMSSGMLSRGSSPKPCPLSQPQPYNIPLVLQIETAFRRVNLEATHTYTVHNYDGSETQRKVTKHADGSELVSEVTTLKDGQKVVKEILHPRNADKPRTNLSMNSIGGVELISMQPQTLPKSPDETNGPPKLSFREICYRDNGAHWYRSSAVLLAYHKWFNTPSLADPGKSPQLKGCLIQAFAPLRLVELRSVPDGIVFHHWEFLHDKPPKEFTLKASEIKELHPKGKEVTMLAEDTYGNILKRRLKMEELESCQEQGKDEDH